MQNRNICVRVPHYWAGPARGGPAEPITFHDKLACVWEQLLAAPSQISVAVDLRSMTK